jgi:Skp family chaperone for outer membrane proteins
MAIKAVLASLDGLDESLHAHYEKGDDGRFYAVVEGVDEMPAVAGLRQAKQTILDEKKQLEKKIEALGVSDPSEIEELRNAAKANSGKQVEELQAKLAQASENAQKEIAKAKEEAEAERQAARTYFKQGEVTRAISAAEGTPELLSHVVDQYIDVARGDDGKFSLRVLGKDGQPRIKDSQGNAFGLDDLVSELKQDPKYGRAFKPEGKSGSGATQTAGGGGGGKTVRSGDMDAFGANLEAIAKGEVTVV